MMPALSTSGVPDAVAGELVTIYATAVASVRQTVLHPPGGTLAGRQARQARAAVLTDRIDRTPDGLKAGTARWVGANFARASADGKALADRQARDAGIAGGKGKPLAGSLHLLDKGTVDVLARDLVAHLGTVVDATGNRAKAVLRQTQQDALSEADVNRILAGGVVKGTPDRASRDLREALRAVAGDTLVVNGRDYAVGPYAGMVARTKTRQASEVARHERLASAGVDVVVVIGRVSNTFCTAFLGQAFSLSGASGKYPPLSSLPGGGPPYRYNRRAGLGGIAFRNINAPYPAAAAGTTVINPETETLAIFGGTIQTDRQIAKQRGADVFDVRADNITAKLKAAARFFDRRCVTAGRCPLYVATTAVASITLAVQAKVLLTWLPPGSVNGSLLSAPVATKTVRAEPRAASVAATTVLPPARVPCNGTVTAATLLASSAVATGGTDYWSASILNLGGAGAGTQPLLAAAGNVNTTSAAGDVLQVTLTATGSPAALANASVSIDVSFTG